MLKPIQFNLRAASRRQVLWIAGSSLAAGVVASAAPVISEQYPGDLAILNVALGLEHRHRRLQRRRWQQTANADQLKLALGFQRDHKRHRDALTKFVRRFGGTPVEPKSSYDFGTIASATDIVKLAQSLEEGAEMAYLTNADKLVNHEILDAAVPILEDEVRHNIVLRQLLGMDVTERMKY